MTQLTNEEREAFRALGEGGLRQPELPRSLRVVLPTPEARLEYIRFATDASRFFFAASARLVFAATIGDSEPRNRIMMEAFRAIPECRNLHARSTPEKTLPIVRHSPGLAQN